MDVKRQATILEASLTNIQRERDDLVKEVWYHMCISTQLVAL